MPDVAAFPFIRVTIDTSALTPVAQRAPGVIAVVGSTVPLAGGNAIGAAAPNQPFQVFSRSEAANLFAEVGAGGVVRRTPLFNSLELALLQDPRPSLIYGVRIDDAGGFAAGLAALEAADDVTFVSLASEVDPANLALLRAHVESMSSEGQKRIGVGMINPAEARTPTYVNDRAAAVAAVKSDSGRMVMIAARGATRDVGGGVVFPADAATAAMAAMAGFPPQTSVLLKQVRGFSLPLGQQYGPSEISGLSRAEIIPIIDPALIPGESLHLAEGATFSTSAALGYVDIVRVLDDVDFRLKAGLIGLIGDARITKAGLTLLQTQIDGILGPLRRAAVIDAYSIDIPLLQILSLPETARSPADNALIATARANRTVDAQVVITYGPAVHLLLLTLAPKF